jgi:hypothetical protein
MATYEFTPQRLEDWIAAGNTLPEFVSSYVHTFLEAQGLTIDGVTIWPDGRVVIESPATQAEIVAALQLMTPGDIDPDKPKQDAYTGIMAQLDAFADAVEAGQTPTAAQTQAAVARLVRVVQYVAARR